MRCGQLRCEPGHEGSARSVILDGLDRVRVDGSAAAERGGEGEGGVLGGEDVVGVGELGKVPARGAVGAGDVIAGGEDDEDVGWHC